MLTAQVIGNLGSDPEQKETQSGTKLCRFSLASNKKIKGEKVTTWVNVTVFDEHKIKYVMDYCRKGTKLFVEGEPQARAYEQNGEAKASLDLTCGFGSKIEICSSEPRDDSAGRSSGGASSSASSTKSKGTTNGWDDLDDDDIPFSR